jgi:hypothetical protein
LHTVHTSAAAWFIPNSGLFSPWEGEFISLQKPHHLGGEWTDFLAWSCQKDLLPASWVKKHMFIS